MKRDSVIISCLLVVIVFLIGVIFVLALNDKKLEEKQTETNESVVSKDNEEPKQGDVVTYTITDAEGNKMYYSDVVTKKSVDSSDYIPAEHTVTKKITTKFIPEGESNLDYQACYIKDSGNYRIAINVNEAYYATCYRITCNNNLYKYDRFGPSIGENQIGYKCLNGNSDPYVVTMSDGCKNLKEGKSCSTDKVTYCTKVYKIDCSKTADNKTYSTTTTKTNRRPTSPGTMTGTVPVWEKTSGTTN